MSARIVVNLEHGLAESAIDRSPDGGTWLSLWQGREVVIVKLSTSSLQALWLTLTKQLGVSAGRETASRDTATEASSAAASTAATKTGRGGAAAWRPPAAEPGPEPKTSGRS